jgi:hypothetical protein
LTEFDKTLLALALMTASVTRHSVQLQVLETTENPKTSEPVVLSDHDSEHDEDKPSTHSKPNRKKKRMPTKSAEAALSKLSRGGKPSNLPDMPLDILFEVIYPFQRDRNG